MARALGAPRHGSFPTTADVGIWARAPTPAGLFEGLGQALFGIMTDLRRVRPRERRTVRASGEDLSSLVVAYLGALLLLEQDDGFVGRTLRVRTVGDPPTSVVATVTGERLDGARHVLRKEVKAVTLHLLSVSLDPPSARAILDI
ncbi:MAG: archease [Thermoplasmata archaeon]|nr:archease [Thermoplasmata archaeon]MCI4359679.1 archease [Thermoplasmata archaeon]